ncbi:MAG: TPM domain-containing protein [Acidobacteria bacterium]|nr:TPM domain-containing protein [Acidobacteriota bacterium]MBV9186343.1 TPM domain-containing protein [Acidobacteriota bacterium]
MNVRRSAIAFVAIALLASAALALDIPPKPTQWVNDYNANLLNASQIQQLNEKLEGFYKKTGVQFLIMIFPSLEGEDDLGYTNKVANVWKVKDDKALMLFVFSKEHKTRIQTGYSLEPVITDAFASDVLHNTVPAYFRAGDYAGGLNAAADQIIGKIDPTAVGATSGPAPRRVRSSRGSASSKIFPLIFFFFIFFVLVPLLSRGRRRGGCGGCFWPMFFGGGGWGGGGTTFGGGGGGGWSTGGSWSGGGSSFGGGGAGGGW